MIGAIGQVAAAVGLVPTLLFLAVQVREQNRARRLASLDVLSAQWSEIIKSVSDSSDFAPIYLRGLAGFDELDPVSKVRFSAYLIRFTKYSEAMHLHYRDGALPASSWATLQRVTEDIMAYPGAQAWWRTRKHWFSPETCQLVDNIISKTGDPVVYQDFAVTVAAR
jgi:hypothetical protein